MLATPTNLICFWGVCCFAAVCEFMLANGVKQEALYCLAFSKKADKKLTCQYPN